MEHPLAREHNVFETEFEKICKKNGLDIVDMSYHHLYPDHVKAKLRNNTTPVSLLIRTTPDYICLNNGAYYELKTGKNPNQLNVEAYPLMCNQIRDKSLKIPCFYVYKGTITDHQIVVCDCKDIKAEYLVFPKDEKNDSIKDTLQDYFKCMCVQREKSKIWSNDAYVSIPAEQVQTWTPLNEYLKQA